MDHERGRGGRCSRELKAMRIEDFKRVSAPTWLFTTLLLTYSNYRNGDYFRSSSFLLCSYTTVSVPLSVIGELVRFYPGVNPSYQDNGSHISTLTIFAY